MSLKSIKDVQNVLDSTWITVFAIITILQLTQAETENRITCEAPDIGLRLLSTIRAKLEPDCGIADRALKRLH